MNRIAGFVGLMRPINCTMMGSAVIIGAALASSQKLSSESWMSLIYGFITGFALTAASMAINDYHDRNIDAINEPDRPIPGGAVTPRQTLVFATMLTVTGFISAYLANVLCLLAAMIAWVIFAAYTTVGKRSGLPGNFLVSACVAIPFVYGSIAIVGFVQLNVLVFASIAFLSNTGREITKGIVDVQGDKAQNMKTLAVRYGDRVAAFVAVMFYLSAVALSPIPWFLKLVSLWFIPFVVVTDLGLIVSSLVLAKDHSRETARKVKKTVLLWFVVGLLAFVFGALG